MTREQYEKELKDLIYNSNNGHIKVDKVFNLTRRILDDFESRTCDNCKHYKDIEYYKDGICLLIKNNGFNLDVEKSFYCNKWEEKND